jgi:hypothetical protein
MVGEKIASIPRETERDLQSNGSVGHRCHLYRWRTALATNVTA